MTSDVTGNVHSDASVHSNLNQSSREPASSAARAPLSIAALAGAVATAAGLALAAASAAVIGVRSAPLIAVSEAVVSASPRWLQKFAIDTFGTADKAVLLGSVIAVTLAVGGFAGAVAARNRRVGLSIAAALPGLALAALLTRPDFSVSQLLPTLLGGAAGLMLLDLFTTRVRRPQIAVPGPARRRFLWSLAGLGAASVYLGGAATWWAGQRMNLESRRADLEASLGVVDVPAGAELGVAGLTSWATGNGDFYRIDTALSVPLVQPDDWRLRIVGMVENPLELTLDDLLARELVERWTTLTCVSNEVGGDLIGNAWWTGALLAPLLQEAKPLSDADMVLSKSVDGWTAGSPLAVLLDGRDAMLAVGMNGDALPVEHGFPVRMVVPGLYGYVSATKWVTELKVTRFDQESAFWTTKGWSDRGPILTSSRIDVPRSGAELVAGDVVVAGVAWAQHRGISSVQVRVDSGPWQRAALASVPTADTWVQWKWGWSATPGRHELEVQAIDGEGAAQEGRKAQPFPSGATGYHRITVEVSD